MKDHKDHPNPHPGRQPDKELSPQAMRLKAMIAVLIEKGVLTREQLDQEIEKFQGQPQNDGAKAVAHAWVDPDFKKRLLANPKRALSEIGLAPKPIISNDPENEHEAQLTVVENTDNLHHVTVCTLCSCYPQQLLGRPPDWYKSLVYRSRIVRDPRGVLDEFGLHIGKDVRIQLLDSTADLRFLVLPQRPKGTEKMSEEELAKLVTRDSMIGTGQPRTP